MSNLKKGGLQLIYNENKYRNNYLQTTNLLRNKLINGAMTISQRGTSFNIPISIKNNTLGANPPTYTLDRWFALSTLANKFTITQENTASSPAPPEGFDNYMKIVPTSSYTNLGSGDIYAIGQYIDYSTYFDMNNGTQIARPLTLSFYVYAELTGTYSGALSNYSKNRDCSYAFSYNVTAANTWENIIIKIDGCQIGTWNSTTNLDVYFALGCGTAAVNTPGAWTSSSNVFGATNTLNLIGTGSQLCITGVKLEQNPIYTPYQFVLPPLELIMCQNYYQQLTLSNGNWPIFLTRTNNPGGGLNYNKTFGSISLVNYLKTTSPNITFSSNVWAITGFASDGNLNNNGIFNTNAGTGVLQNSSVYVDNPNVGPGIVVNQPIGGTLAQNGVTLNAAWNFSVTANISNLITTDHSFNINIDNATATTMNSTFGYCFVWTPTSNVTVYVNAEIYPIN